MMTCSSIGTLTISWPPSSYPMASVLVTLNLENIRCVVPKSCSSPRSSWSGFVYLLMACSTPGPNICARWPRGPRRGHLAQMFGPGVEQAISKYTNPDQELLGLLQLFGTTQRIFSKFKVTSTDAIGYDDSGHEIVRVPIDEQVIIRDPAYLNIT